MRARFAVEPVAKSLTSFMRAKHPIHLAPAEVDKITCGPLPAMSRWFQELGNGDGASMLNRELWVHHAEHHVEMELRQSAEPHFSRFGAPIGLFVHWQERALSQPSGRLDSKEDIALYIAQSSLDTLPAALIEDIPTPPVIAESDSYGSSLWLGIPPTKTPLHRDPNDNLFIQLSGTKTFRLLQPKDGTFVVGDRKVRTEDDLMGKETEEVEKWLWTEEQPAIQDMAEMTCLEATVNANEGLYIPRGWWHSVHGAGKGINASINWWFRPRG